MKGIRLINLAFSLLLGKKKITEFIESGNSLDALISGDVEINQSILTIIISGRRMLHHRECAIKP